MKNDLTGSENKTTQNNIGLTSVGWILMYSGCVDDRLTWINHKDMSCDLPEHGAQQVTLNGGHFQISGLSKAWMLLHNSLLLMVELRANQLRRSLFTNSFAGFDICDVTGVLLDSIATKGTTVR